ncbi:MULTISPECIES: cytochrome d ubiquinol oxidase subunit II [unclassified Frigoribacterium]|jgi:cytochrome d ubiquinol oxidase subunit II|uniref:cytochrome d ubiquinol oxidase subunit II n=1 Tax=unclassified Frigoribacterium TaxID=2627005 RepID=UPI0006F46D92|nr:MULTISPECIES: cytochrome d ubiquinol oxidase subunit II [unclassified Frigoribacterium]KQN45743.1 cytochrome C oxidase assembly protein [Frigoribacterium sp. Leaf44]MBD8539095.1 cytochrome d ubiquinol oxidase subunit II [Frigoribacterium sp. CFBP 8751]OII27416.1 cytochrome d ubiquinol oxidase subunit II [Frigoribacterium sp. MCBA15_019]
MDLPTLWFVILGFFFVGYFVLDGFDFGVGMSLPFLGRDDTDRRVLINTIGPVWDLNETWVIVAGAFLFAAFPEWYATLFSGFYLLMLLILLALIARGVSFEYRHQRPESSWKRRFDLMIVVGSAVPAFVWGLVFANVVQGVPLDEGHNYTGTLLDLLNPYALLGGLTTLLLFFTHGVVFVTLKTEGEIRGRARRLATRAGVVTIVVAAAFLALTSLMHGTLVSVALSAVAAVTLIASFVANLRGREGRSFGLMAVTIALAVSSLFAALFPGVMPASNDPANSLTIANASSSTYTLTIMSWVALVFVPLILGYQGFTYWIFRKRITRAAIPAAH